MAFSSASEFHPDLESLTVSSPRTLTLLSIAVLALTASACTRQVRPEPSPLRAEGERLHLKVRYFISEQQRDFVHEDHFLVLGIANTWNIELGRALARGFPQVLTTVFDSVEPAASPRDIGDANALLVLSLESFSIDGASFVARVAIQVRATDRASTQIMEEELAGVSQSDAAAAAWIGGVFAGEQALRQSTEGALNDLSPKLARRLRQVFEPRAGDFYGL